MIYVRTKIGEAHLVPDDLHPDYHTLSDDASRQDGPVGQTPTREVLKSESCDESVATVTAAPCSCEGEAGRWGGEETCNPEGSGQLPRPISKEKKTDAFK